MRESGDDEFVKLVRTHQTSKKMVGAPRTFVCARRTCPRISVLFLLLLWSSQYNPVPASPSVPAVPLTLRADTLLPSQAEKRENAL